jgi:3-methyladenine DNA glycosylase AlkD
MERHMTRDEALDRLRGLFNPATWALHEKNGAGGAQMGVKLGDIRTVAKAIRSDHALALELWDTGIVDARLLAILIMKPALLTVTKLDTLVRSNSFLQVSDWLNSYVVKANPDKESLRAGWMDSDHPIAARAGWSLTAERVTKSPEGLDLGALLDRIEAEMPGAPQPAQWTMNNTLAAIGINHPALRERAIDIGERLGIYRNYPVPKGCTSPFAPLWIGEMVRRAG